MYKSLVQGLGTIASPFRIVPNKVNVGSGEEIALGMERPWERVRDWQTRDLLK